MLLAVVIVVVVVNAQTNKVKCHNPRNERNYKGENPYSLFLSLLSLLQLGTRFVFGNGFKLCNLTFDKNNQILHRQALENSDVKSRYTC